MLPANTTFIKMGLHFRDLSGCCLIKDPKMSKLIPRTYPVLVGLNQLEYLVERSEKTGNEGYPHYNIEHTSKDFYRITLAVASFTDNDLSITVDDCQLVILGSQSDYAVGRVYLLWGIAAKLSISPRCKGRWGTYANWTVAY